MIGSCAVCDVAGYGGRGVQGEYQDAHPSTGEDDSAVPRRAVRHRSIKQVREVLTCFLYNLDRHVSPLFIVFCPYERPVDTGAELFV